MFFTYPSSLLEDLRTWCLQVCRKLWLVWKQLHSDCLVKAKSVEGVTKGEISRWCSKIKVNWAYDELLLLVWSVTTWSQSFLQPWTLLVFLRNPGKNWHLVQGLPLKVDEFYGRCRIAAFRNRSVWVLSLKGVEAEIPSHSIILHISIICLVPSKSQLEIVVRKITIVCKNLWSSQKILSPSEICNDF